MSCLFCRIIAGEIPSERLFENDQVLAFLDLHPVHPGHALIVPKQHADGFRSLPVDQIAPLFEAAQTVSRAIQSATGAPAFNLELNDGADAGQVIFHAHLHIIPRFAGDGLHPWPGTAYPEGGMAAMGEKIRGAL